MNRKLVLAAVLAAPAVLAPAAGARELSLQEALAASERNSPRLKASELEEKAAHEGVGSAESYYYPSVAAEGIDSWGFPGSSGALGVQGLMGSPYRSGAAAGVIARQTLFDFGRTYQSVKTARSAEQVQRQATELDRYAVDRDVLETYYQCSRYRSQRETWIALHDETELVAKEVERYVGTGQRSIVDRYLSEAQVEEARTNRNFFRSRMESTLARLALLMGSSEKDLSCPPLPADDAGVPLSTATAAGNPLVARAKVEVQLAETRLSGAKADYLPKVVGVASVGGMDKVRLVTRKDYSGGLGLIVPLFDGLGTVHKVGEARARLDASREALAATRLQVDELNARYDEIINASRARLEHLDRELKLADEGFKVAKSRYFKFQGTLVDLREALRNLGRIQVDHSETQANLIEALGAKALLNGAAVQR